MLLDRFRSLGALLCASAEAIDAVVADERLPRLISAVRSAHLHVLRARIDDGAVLSSPEALAEYLFGTLAHQPRECIHVLFLNGRNRLLRDEPFGAGSPVEAVVQPREILRRALELGATALILVHNHPSGDPTPSHSDKLATTQLSAAAALLNIRVHDHVIVASGGMTSLRSLGLLS